MFLRYQCFKCDNNLIVNNTIYGPNQEYGIRNYRGDYNTICNSITSMCGVWGHITNLQMSFAIEDLYYISSQISLLRNT